MKFQWIAILALFSLSLSACGGGSSDDDPVNTAPTANAGENQTVFPSQLITLDASASSDPEGNDLTYSWTFFSRPVGSIVTLSDATAATPTFTPDLDGAYVLVLVVNDGLIDSAADLVTINSPSVTNLSGLDLSGFDLSGLDLTGADLTETNLSGANLTNANLYEANLRWANLYEANLRWANFYEVDLFNANLSNTFIYETIFTVADLTGANFTGAIFKGAYLTGAIFTGANLTGASFNGADLAGADLIGADLTGTDWFNTICPDGTNSDSNGNTCVGHL